MKKLKIILQSNFFKILIVIALILRVALYYVNIPKDNLNVSNITIKIEDFYFTSDKLVIFSKDTKLSYYFKSEELTYLKDNINYGTKISITGKSSSVNTSLLPYNMDYSKYNRLNGLYYSFSINQINDTKESKSPFYWLKNRVYRYLLTKDNYEYYLALIMGNKHYISNEEKNIFNNNGISHLIAISGMHLGIFLLMINKSLKILKIKKVPKNIIIIIFLSLFMFITNYTASLLRAVFLYLGIKINKKYGIFSDNRKVLVLISSILIIIKPSLVFNIGFIYSNFSVYGLLSYQFSGSKFKQLFSVSIITFLYTVIITAYLNHQINILSIIINIILVPFMTYLLFPSLLLNLIIPITPIVNILLKGFITINEYFSHLNFLKVVVPAFPIMIVIIYYLILDLSRKVKKRQLIILALSIFIVIKLIYYFDFNNYVYYLDVGQGDSALIVLGQEKKTILIDTGGIVSFDNTKAFSRSTSFINFFYGKNIRKLDYLIISHGDYDHLGDAINLVNNFKVENVIFNNDSYNSLEKELIKVLEKKNIKYYQGINELKIGNAKISFLNTIDYGNENDNSNVIYIKLNNNKFLFMGDAGVNREKDILNKYNLNNIDFIKIGHHGSNTSSSKEFIASIKPKYCLISVGKNNRYGHPKDSVIDILDDYCQIYRTDIDGNIKIKINKNNYKIKIYSSQGGNRWKMK